MLAILVGIGFLLVSPITSQISHFEHNFPSIVRNANRDLADVQTWLNQHGINVHIQKQGQTALQTLQKDVLKRSGDIVSFSRDLLSGLVTIGFDLVLVLVLVGLPADLRQTDRRAGAPDHARRRRHARG